ncbi:radical SAM protein [Streptomyces sp. NPDC003077]|uniref:radical SAM protein n=1 Tax=Streptomyces sp. NPDC003077 TaxID=3154443 RepID=UPI0033A332F5
MSGSRPGLPRTAVSGSRPVRRQHQDVTAKPFLVIWESTRACPLACLHCRAVAVPDRDPRELDTRAAKDLIDQIAAFGHPAPLFVITGGDPFQRPDLLELIAYGTRTGVRVAVSPSGAPTLTAENLRAVHGAGAVGLRSRAHAVTGDPYAEEPWCGYRPGSFPHQRELAELLGRAGGGG